MPSDISICVQDRPRALVTGGTGFLGSHLVQALLAAGWEVHLLVRSTSSNHPPTVHTHLYRGETADVLQAVERSRPKVVFHLASLFLAQHTPEQIVPLLQSNLVLGTQLLEAMRIAGVHSLINTGTCWQYFERDIYTPVNLYAATKQAFEDVLAYYVEVTGLHAITLSLFDTYGPGDARKKLLPLLLDSLQNDTVLEMSPGHQILDLVHVDDLCAAYLHAADLVCEPKRPPITTYAISGGQRRSLRELVALLEQAAGRPLRISWGARPYRERELMQPWSGTPLPGWSPRVDLLAGFQELLKERSLLGDTWCPGFPWERSRRARHAYLGTHDKGTMWDSCGASQKEGGEAMDKQTGQQNVARASAPGTLGIAMVKNEQDSIEVFVRHNLTLLDHLVVIDNGSVDDTRSILTHLAAECPRLVLAEDDEFGYNQSERMTRWLHEYQSQFAADFVLPLDADEFLNVEAEQDFHDLLGAIPEGGYGLVPWCTYVLTPGLDTTGKDPFRVIEHRRRRELPARYKAVIRLDGKPAADLVLTQGNHAVRSASGREIEGIRLKGLRLLHYPLRSLDQAKAKCVVGWMAYLALDPRTGETKQGHTWRSSFNRFVSGPPVDHDALCEMSLLYTQDLRRIDWANDVVEEPSPLVYERRYSTGNAMDATQVVARSWEQSVTHSGRHSPSLKIAALMKEQRPEDEAQQPTLVQPKPTETDALSQMVQQGRTAEAIQYLETALLKGETAEVWNDWATLQCSSGDLAKAEEGYRRARQLDETHRQTAINLGLLLLARGQLQEGSQILNPHAPTLTVEEKKAIEALIAPHRAALQAETRPALIRKQDTPAYPASSSLIDGRLGSGPASSRRKYLIVVRAGGASLHPTWLEGSAPRNWDLLVHSYGPECPWSNEEGVEILRAVGSDIQGPKMRAIHSLYTQKRDLFLAYDYICLADDDLAASLETFNRMFLLCEHYGLELAQPALTHDSHMGNWSITMENTSFLLRYTNFVEVMCPVFSRAFLDLCAPTFQENLSGYGLDLLWSSWVSSPWKSAILDACPVRHTRASFSGHLYKMLAEMGVNPDQELIDFIKRWHLVREEDQIPGQVVIPTSANFGGILRDQTRITVHDGHGVELIRALLNGFPRELASQHPKVMALLYPVIRATLARYEHGDPDPDRPEREKTKLLAHQ